MSVATPPTSPRTGNPWLMLALATVGFAVNFWAWALISPLGALYLKQGAASPLGQLSQSEVALMVAVPVIVGSLDMGYEWEVPQDHRIHQLSNLPDSDLVDLYRGASLFIFPSSAEGFGIPLLDATLFGLPVISSNRTSMPEVAGSLATYFDPEESDAQAVLGKLISGHFGAEPIRWGSASDTQAQLRKFSWRSVARRFAQIVSAVAV